MLNEFVKGKVYIFIAAANIFYTQKTLNWRISYEKLMKYLKMKIIKENKIKINRITIKLSDVGSWTLFYFNS
ncbi:hypothetical protein AMJ49_06475 [Parcubacteria bacterium DG_74_2]|nr:MAG: hypothetical protein AMJ49_06475 [Parcubacteria bacterium DG_74_2]